MSPAFFGRSIRLLDPTARFGRPFSCHGRAHSDRCRSTTCSNPHFEGEKTPARVRLKTVGQTPHFSAECRAVTATPQPFLRRVLRAPPHQGAPPALLRGPRISG